MNREELKRILPHREPMLLLDEAEVSGDGTAVGSYTVKGDEWFLQGHFPGNPVVPGVILCEIMAQTCCVLLQEKIGEQKAQEEASASNLASPSDLTKVTPYYTGLNNVKFRTPVKPGDVLKLTCSIWRVKEPFYFAKGKGTVEGKLCVSGEFSFALVR